MKTKSIGEKSVISLKGKKANISQAMIAVLIFDNKQQMSAKALANRVGELRLRSWEKCKNPTFSVYNRARMNPIFNLGRGYVISLSQAFNPEEHQFVGKLVGVLRGDIKEVDELPVFESQEFYKGFDIRELMIKYKYDTITNEELNIFHKSIEDLIHDEIHSHFCTMEHQEITSLVWEKIIRFRHKWDETRKNKVSTWIGTVTRNMISTIQLKEIRRNNRTVTISDVVSDSEMDEKKFIEQNAVQQDSDLSARREKVYDFCDSLENELDKRIIQLVIAPEQSLLEEYSKGRKSVKSRLFIGDICSILGMKRFQLERRLKKIKPVFYEAMSEFDD